MPSVHEHHLPNGLTLLCCSLPHLHSVQFGLYLKGGSLYENEQTQGISHLLEHLCFRGLGELDHEQIGLLQSRMGTDLNGATYPEGIVFTMFALPRFFSDLLRLFRRFFLCTPWSGEVIRKEKQVVLRQVEQEEPDFEDEVVSRYRANLSGAFPVMGTVESVEALTPETIRLWQRMIFQPQNACLCISGNFTKAMEATAVSLLSELSNYTEQPPFSQTMPQGFCKRDAQSDWLSPEEGGQARVHLAFDIDADTVYPVMDEVISAITAGSNDSLLFQTLREEQTLVAEIESFIEETGSYRRLVISYDARQEVLCESLRAVFRLLQRLKMYIRPVRIMLSRMQFTDNLAMYEDSAAGMNEMMGWAWIADDMGQCDLEAQARMYDDLTVEDLLDAAQAIFRPAALTASVRYDPEFVREEELAEVLKECRGMLD